MDEPVFQLKHSTHDHAKSRLPAPARLENEGQHVATNAAAVTTPTDVVTPSAQGVRTETIKQASNTYTAEEIEAVPAPPSEEPLPVPSGVVSTSVTSEISPTYVHEPVPTQATVSQVPMETSVVTDMTSYPSNTIGSTPCVNVPCDTACGLSGGCPSPVCQVRGVHCPGCRDCGTCMRWRDAGWIPWDIYAQGEYIGPARLPHVPEYRLRVDDLIEFVYRLTREKSNDPYRIEVADELKIESLTAPNLDREVIVQPDGNITVRQLGQVPAAGLTIDELRASLEENYRSLIADPSISVTPLTMNTMLDELRNTVDARAGQGGQSRTAVVTPEGTIRLPAVGTVLAQGLTLEELQREIEARYSQLVDGLEVTPILVQRAPRFVYVTGEVVNPGRFELTGPTTISQAIAMAGSWNVGANLHHIVVFRRDENWQLMATRLDLHSTLFNPQPCPYGEIWLRDNDIIIVPKHPILVMDDLIDLIFTRGVYGVVPVIFGVNFAKLGTI